MARYCPSWPDTARHGPILPVIARLDLTVIARLDLTVIARLRYSGPDSVIQGQTPLFRVLQPCFRVLQPCFRVLQPCKAVQNPKSSQNGRTVNPVSLAQGPSESVHKRRSTDTVSGAATYRRESGPFSKLMT